MSGGLRDLRAADLDAELERVLVPRLAVHLGSHGPGHCMRVTDLDPGLMASLCARLRQRAPGAQVCVLSDGPRQGVPDEFLVTSTKLVELRNPLPDGSLRPPLLVFIPNDLRASAEDSFGVATFEEVALGDVYASLAALLLEEVPNGLRAALSETIRRLEAEAWPFADPVAVVRFLITVKLNDYDSEAAGAALFELGLVPDFKVFLDPAHAAGRIVRNMEAMRVLTWSSKSERGRVLDLGLIDRAFRAQLGHYVAEIGLEDPRVWTRRIVVEREHRGLSFHHWRFDEVVTPDAIFVEVIETSLPSVAGDESDATLGRLTGQRYLPTGPGGLRQFGVTFRVNPIPKKVQGLARFAVEIVSADQGSIGVVKSVAARASNRDRITVTFNKLHRVDWEEGWHFVRVRPLTSDADPVPLLDEKGDVLPQTNDAAVARRRPNESDLFYVVPGGNIEVVPDQRTVPREESLTHAWKRLQFSALLEGRDPSEIAPRQVRWLDRSERARPAGALTIEANFGREGVAHIPVPRHLKALEQQILSAPDGPVSWRLSIRAGEAGAVVPQPYTWPSLPETDLFLEARARYFSAVRSEGRELVTQVADLRALRPLVVAYAEAYGAIVRTLLKNAEARRGAEGRNALADLRRALTLDSITLEITDYRGQRREAALLAPTHPVRALWLAVWAEVGEAWLRSARDGKAEHVGSTRDTLLRRLSPVCFPAVLVRDTGRLLAPVENFGPFWSLYGHPREEDTRRLVGDVCAALGVPEPEGGGQTVTGDVLASRFERYLVQHPYVRTLTINAFNPGRGGVLADMLLVLQKKPVFSDLSYDVRLFVPDAKAPGVGDALVELLSPAGNVAAREAEAFSALGESHLRPKLGLAIRAAAEFRDRPDAYPAHVSILFDVFPAEQIGVTDADERGAVAPVHGLVQDFRLEYLEDEHTVLWHRSPRHGRALDLSGAEEATDLLSDLPTLLSTAAAAVATGQPGLNQRPVVTLALDGEARSLLHGVHEVSDWVVTVDRNMGIEFFDHGGRPGRPEYLIDHSPEQASAGYKLVITSRSLHEQVAMLGPALAQFGLEGNEWRAAVVLGQLRSLSGRLALKLLSAPTQQAEALGLALSRMYLEYQGVFRNQIVVPLDAHLDLYRELHKQADEMGGDVSFKRTDLALFDLDSARRTVTCRLVEVKCYSSVGDLDAYARLKERIAEQVAQSEEVLGRHYDPHRTQPDRSDRLVKTREFSLLLEFYLDRSVRYGLTESEAEREARALIDAFELGYRMEFTRSALVFDFEKQGTEPPEIESGIEFHRIGKDLILSLLDAAVPESGRAGEESPGRKELQGTDFGRTRSLATIALPVPRLQQAAFLGTDRDRSIDVVAQPLDRDDAMTREPEPTHASPSDDASHAPVDELGVESVEGDEARPERSTAPPYDLLLGRSSPSPQYGILGECAGRRVAIDLHETHTMSLFGVQGAGKSYTLGGLVEMAVREVPGINVLPGPLAAVIFHYSPTLDYAPEFLSMREPNDEPAQLAVLRSRYGAEPAGIGDIVLLVPEGKLAERQTEYPGVDVRPLRFSADELKANHWRFLMGAVGSQATYIRQLKQILKKHQNNLSLDAIRQEIDASRLPDHLKNLAHQRLELASDYVGEGPRVDTLLRPGRLLIVDLRDEFIERDEALGLFVVLLQLFADARYEGKEFNKLVVFDEAHKYMESPDLIAGLIEVVREMRHKGTSILVASQDPPSVPVALIELSTQIVLHRFNSPAWLKHVQKANTSLTELTPEKMVGLAAGEAFIWSAESSGDASQKGIVKVRCRPRVTRHGGGTKTATRRTEDN